jgi:phosphate/sulfate permease
MVFTDFLVCVSHGSNDVANAISPLIVLMKLPPNVHPDW